MPVMRTKGNMKILTPGDQIESPIGASIFLAGPTPREHEVESWRPGIKSWRPEALDILEGLSFAGTVFVPERDDWVTKFDYHDQIEWELCGLECCTRIAFWIPREMISMPALTTNVELGMFIRSGRVVYGRPIWAVHCRYIDHLYRKFYGIPCEDLVGLLKKTKKEVENG